MVCRAVELVNCRALAGTFSALPRVWFRMPPDATRHELDRQTLAACRRGDARAFGELLGRYQDRVYALCLALAGAADAEDLAQETFVRVHRHIARFDPDGPARLGTWILMIARRLCGDRARSARLRVEAYAPVYAAASFYPPNLWADGPMKSKGQIQEELATAQKDLDKAQRRLRSISSPDIAFYQDELQKALQNDPENREIVLDLAELALASKDLDGADGQVKKILDAQPDNRRAKQLKGIILFQRGKLDEAKAILEEAISLNPNPELIHYYLGQIYEKQGDTAKALAHYHESLRRFVHEPGDAAAPAAPAAPASPTSPTSK